MEDFITKLMRRSSPRRKPAAPTPPSYDTMQGFMNPDFDSANWPVRPASARSYVVSEDDLDAFLPIPSPPT